MTQIYRYAGFAEETTYNEDPTPAPDFYADIASASLDTPSDTELVYAGGISRGPRLHRPGYYSPAGNVVYADSVNTIARALRWALGGYVFTGDSPLNTHEMYATEDTLLPSFAIRIGKDNFEHRFRGCAINTLQLSVSDGFAQMTLDVGSAQDEKAALTPDVIDLLEDVAPFVFHEVTISLDGNDDSALVSSLNLNIGNSLDMPAGRGLGSRHPVRAPVSTRSVAFDMSMWYPDTAQLERVWGGATAPVDGGSVELPVIITLDAGADGSVVLSLPRVVWTAVSTQPSGQARIDQTVNAMAYLEPVLLADALTTVQTEILATVSNDQATLV